MTLFGGNARSLGIAAAAALCLFGATLPARAQAVVAFVNGNPITAFDVDQRMRINSLVTRKGTSRQQALQDLVDDKIKIIEARRIGYRLTEDNVDDQVGRIAKSNNQTTPEFLANLARAGIDANAYRQKLRADYSWELALQAKIKNEANASSAEVNEIVAAKLKDGSAKVTDYELIPVIFVVARTDGNAGARERQASAARASFRNCDEGVEALRKISDVAIKPMIKRSSDALSPQLKAVLDKTAVGHLTAPFRTDQGVEMVAVCGKSERVDTSNVRAAAEKQIAEKKAANLSTEHLKTLRSRALIQYK